MTMQSKYVVVAICVETGEIAGLEEYDPANDSSRDNRIAVAVRQLAGRLGVEGPEGSLRRMAEADGYEWMRSSAGAELEVGMVEVGIGKWGFPQD